MAEGRTYSREKNGRRFIMRGGMVTSKPPDTLSEGEYAYLQNVRTLIDGRITDRPPISDPLFNVGNPPDTIVRMNDSTPSGPLAGFVRLVAAGSNLFVNATEVAAGFSGNPMAILPFSPDQSVQPWAYTADPSHTVNISSTGQPCTGMVKVRSDGLTRKTGIKEPQTAPVVGVNSTTVTEWLTLPANTPPWTNIGGVNASFNYSGTDVQPPYPTSILTPVAGSTVTLAVTGTATVNGSTHAPGDAGPTTAGFPGDFIVSAKIVVFAFTDANGNIIAQSTAGGAPPVVGNIGAGVTLTVPAGAAQLQIGIDSQGGNFAANSGQYKIQATVSTSAVTTVTSIVGQITAYVWGDSPHSGPVANYIWKNPNDGGTGISRTISTAQANASNNSLIFDSSPEDGTVPVQWTTNDSTGSSIGSVNLFDPALESEGYQDFNAAIVGSLFFPAGGTYAIQFQNKDQIIFGMGGGVTSDSGIYGGSFQQSITMADGLPILWTSTPNGSGGAVTNSFNITVPAQGVYPFEVDWDYWFHTGRKLIVKIAPAAGGSVATIPPLPQGVRQNVSYAYKHRASETGAQSNPSPFSPVQQTPVLANTVTSAFSIDPQVTKVDYYRQDSGLPNYTYVATGPNDGLGGTVNGIVYNTPITDTLSDLAAASNQILQTDDFEPFPSIDTPKSGFVTIIDGVITWKSGDTFNTRWLPGTLILIGSPTQNAYSLVARPISTTQIVIPSVPDTIGDSVGNGVPYNIAQPILAQEPLPSMWGPDAYGFMHACGDPNQPGAYVWTKAYNPDSAPQTNRLLLTSASEILMGGGLVNGISMVFSTLRAWLMYPNFADAQATTEGISGNQWNPILAVAKRGLYIRNCLCPIGGKALAFRGEDGIYATSGGGAQSITDDTIYNLFPHEGALPQRVDIGTFSVFPPDDTKPQTLSYQPGFIYWGYKDANSTPHTLVYDEKGKGWSVDTTAPALFTCHAGESAPGVNDTAVGLSDGSVCVMGSGPEVGFSAVITGVDNVGDARARKRLGDIYMRALIQAIAPVSLTFRTNQYQALLSDLAPTSLAGTGALLDYVIDWTDGIPSDLRDISVQLTWNIGAGNQLDLWQPSWLSLPETTGNRAGDWMNLGTPGNKLIQGLTLECNTFGANKTFSVEDDQNSLHVPLELPLITNGQTVKTFTFNPPFVSHQVRIVSTDTVAWQFGPTDGWAIKWEAQPYPEGSQVWTAEAAAYGLGYKHCFAVNLAYISSVPVLVLLNTDQGQFTVGQFPATTGLSPQLPAKIYLRCPPNKWKTCIFSVIGISPAPVYVWRDLTQAWIGEWGRTGEYTKMAPFGGASNPAGQSEI